MRKAHLQCQDTCGLNFVQMLKRPRNRSFEAFEFVQGLVAAATTTAVTAGTVTAAVATAT